MQKLLKATLDFVFKLVFGSEPNKDVLKAFLNDHLTFDGDDELDDITLINPFLLKEYDDDKYGILDIKAKTKRGALIDMEIQVELLPSIGKRELFYRSKLVTGQVASGDDYELIQPVITILILTENCYNDSVYHHKFINYDPVNNIPFSNPDLTQSHVLELGKLDTLTQDSPEWSWGKLISSDDEEELNMLAAQTPELSKAVETIKRCSIDPALRARAESREMARMDEAVRRRAAITEALEKARMDEAVRRRAAIKEALEKAQMDEAVRRRAAIKEALEKAQMDEAVRRRAAIKEYVERLSEKEAQMAEKDIKMAEKDIKMAEKDAEIVKLLARLSEYEKA